MTGVLLVRTVVGESRADLEAKVEAARREGWQATGCPSRLFVGGRPAEGRGSWVQHMRKG
jgi:hypothetical protein